MVLLGNLAVRTGGRIEWDAKTHEVKNNRDAQKYVKREYRKGGSCNHETRMTKPE
jgi:hypothetical protein